MFIFFGVYGGHFLGFFCWVDRLAFFGVYQIHFLGFFFGFSGQIAVKKQPMNPHFVLPCLALGAPRRQKGGNSRDNDKRLS